MTFCVFVAFSDVAVATAYRRVAMATRGRHGEWLPRVDFIVKKMYIFDRNNVFSRNNVRVFRDRASYLVPLLPAYTMIIVILGPRLDCVVFVQNNVIICHFVV